MATPFHLDIKKEVPLALDRSTSQKDEENSDIQSKGKAVLKDSQDRSGVRDIAF